MIYNKYFAFNNNKEIKKKNVTKSKTAISINMTIIINISKKIAKNSKKNFIIIYNKFLSYILIYP